MSHLALAYPRKHFFLEMFTRDIALEDCVLDLIDNAIDGLIRSRGIDINASLLTQTTNGGKHSRKLPIIHVEYSDQEFKISDTCGGIDRDKALKEIFNFGHTSHQTGGTLGVYGIGLKRAIFKIGNRFEMESRTTKDGFTVDLKVNKWAEKDQSLDDWKIPLEFVGPAPSRDEAGTTIRIGNLRDEVKMRVNDGVFAQKLHLTISQTYGLFIGRFVTIELNGKPVEAFHIPIGESKKIHPARDKFEVGDVSVNLFASLAAREPNGEWTADKAGWYVLCNGRIVLAADKTELTGWGTSGMPLFHMGKYRGFVGVAFFQSDKPLDLPWTTTKRGLNRESAVYQHARSRMRGAAKPILSFLDSMYKEESPEEESSKEIADNVKPTPLSLIASKRPAPFTIIRARAAQVVTTVTISYRAERSDVERVRKHLKKPSWAAYRVGQFTFQHYLKTECPQ
jgi:histidine kinase/DNA gyrase B/HSP90-like ATPase